MLTWRNILDHFENHKNVFASLKASKRSSRFISNVPTRNCSLFVKTVIWYLELSKYSWSEHSWIQSSQRGTNVNDIFNGSSCVFEEAGYSQINMAGWPNCLTVRLSGDYVFSWLHWVQVGTILKDSLWRFPLRAAGAEQPIGKLIGRGWWAQHVSLASYVREIVRFRGVYQNCTNVRCL